MTKAESTSLRIAFQMDSLDIVDVVHDATFSMMHAAQTRGHKIWHYQLPNIRM